MEKDIEEIRAKKKAKVEKEAAWEETREVLVDSWRSFGDGKPKKEKKEKKEKREKKPKKMFGMLVTPSLRCVPRAHRVGFVSEVAQAGKRSRGLELALTPRAPAPCGSVLQVQAAEAEGGVAP